MARVDAETANSGQQATILTSEAVEFLHLLQSHFAPCRQQLLAERDQRQRRYDLDQAPHSLPKIEQSGDTDWVVKPPLADQALGAGDACLPSSERTYVSRRKRRCGYLDRGLRRLPLPNLAQLPRKPCQPAERIEHSGRSCRSCFRPAAQLEPRGKTLPGRTGHRFPLHFSTLV